MARVVVVGGGYGGLASAARLAKLGHEVTLLEAGDALGGALVPVEAAGFTWDAAATTTTVPAVVRDLFRKSGRPLEAELAARGTELVPLDVVRQHRFDDRTRLTLPTSRARQIEAFDALGPGLGGRWAAWVDGFSPVWEVLRRGYFEEPWLPESASREVTAILDSRETLHKRLRRTFRDERLELIAGHPFVADGHDLRDVPVWAGLTAYLEQCFGVWTVPEGMHVLRDLLEARLATRGVVVLRDTPVQDLVVREGRVVAVRTDEGEVDADVVVVAVDPRRLPALSGYVERLVPAMPPAVTYLGLLEDAAADDDLAHEVVLHGDPLIVLRRGGTAPEGHVAWTLHARGQLGEDILTVLARKGIDVRERVVARLDRSVLDLVQTWHGSPLGVLWRGRATVRHRLGPTTPVAGVHLAGAHATPGSGLAYVGLSAAQVATVIGASGSP